MIAPELRAEMRRLVLRLHWRIETVARRFGVHHSTVRRALEAGPAAGEVASTGILDPYKSYLVERLTEAPELSSMRLLAELKARGYPGGVAVVRRYVAKVRSPRPRKTYLRIDFEPGEQAQVDWGSFGHLRIGSHQRPLSCFAMVLSYSRALFIDFSLDCCEASLLMVAGSAWVMAITVVDARRATSVMATAAAAWPDRR